jgi:hypothetical protein
MRMKKMFMKTVIITFLFCVILMPAVLADTTWGTTFETKMVSDKDVYAPGDTITYKIWADTTIGPKFYRVDLCPWSEFVIDPNVEDLSHNYDENFGSDINGECKITGNTVTCTGKSLMYLWSFSSLNKHGFITVPPSIGGGEHDFMITGKVNPGTPLGTTLTSTSTISCFLENGDGIADHATNQVLVGINEPEFPTLLIPLAMIIGFIGIILFTRRTGEK